MKMETPVLQVVRFGAADVIATSGTGIACGNNINGNWSGSSYKATSESALLVSGSNGFIYTNSKDNGSPLEPGKFNMLDGECIGDNMRDKNGSVFTVGKYYHYDQESLVQGKDNVYSKWISCTDPDRHSN